MIKFKQKSRLEIFKLFFILLWISTSGVIALKVDKDLKEELKQNSHANILLPFSLYERILLSKALDEHRAVELDEKNNKNNKVLPKYLKKEDKNEENKTIIIYLPPSPYYFNQSHIAKTIQRKNKFDDKRLEQQRRRRPNPQLMLFKSHSAEQNLWKDKQFVTISTINPSKYSKHYNKKGGKHVTSLMSSDEQNTPIKLFLPAPIKQNKNYNKQVEENTIIEEKWKPVKRILSSPRTSSNDYLNNGMTKQIIPIVDETPLPSPILPDNNRDIKSLGSSPIDSTNNPNNVNDIASKLFGNLFSSTNQDKPRMAAAPLTGSPFDLFGNNNGGGLSSLASSGGQSVTSNPLLQMLSQGSTLEQITILARNLLQMSNGNKEILSTLMNAITGANGGPSKLTNSALSATASLQKQPLEQQNNLISSYLYGNKTNSLPSSVIIEDEEILGNSSSKYLEADEIKQVFSNGTTLSSLNGFSLEQRKLLAAAVLNGELDPEQAVKLLTSENETIANETISELNKTNNLDTSSSLFDYEDEQQKEAFYGKLNKPRGNRLINSESKLIEWIQQNRPRHSSEMILNESTTNKTTNLLNQDFMTTERLPYYGTYCGSFVEQTNIKHNIAGAVWAVDERHLLITKFNFVPISKNENITFWGGPSHPTGNAALDMLPSDNGFIIEAIPIVLNIFNGKPIEIEAKITFNNNTQMRSEANTKNETSNNGLIKNSKNVDLLAEREEEEEEEKIIAANNSTILTNSKRDVRNEIFDNLNENSNYTISNDVDNKIEIINKNEEEEKVKIKENKLIENTTTSTSFNKKENNKNNTKEELKQVKNLILFQHHHQTTTLFLTLPPERLTKLLDWLAIWEHGGGENKEAALAIVLMPKGTTTHSIPSIVQIRSFSSPSIGINGIKMLQSGPINILDTKTIEVTEFTFLTDNLPAWFMIGKEIMPNSKGHIVPIFDRITKSFNCDSLREYHNETITLRLPDPFDIKDVFWFAIFSIPRSIPLAHIYIPYNDMQLPPDLQSIQTPQCIWRRTLSNGNG